MDAALITAVTTSVVTVLGAITALVIAIRTHGNTVKTITGNATANLLAAYKPMLSAAFRLMYDGINADAAIIRSVYQVGNLVCYYVAGNSFIWTAAQKALFPSSALVGITLTASYTGPGSDVLDVENGGASESQVKGWIEAKKKAGYGVPTIYASLSLIPGIVEVVKPFVLGTDYDIWVAHWDGTTVIPYPAAAAKQFRNAGPYDVSVVFDNRWPRRIPTNAPPPVINFDLHVQTGTVVLEWNVPSGADHCVVTYGTAVYRPRVAPGETTVSLSVPYQKGTVIVNAIVNGAGIHIGSLTFP